MILSYHELCELIEQKVIDAPISAVQGSSIDLTLGNVFYFEKRYVPHRFDIIDISEQCDWMFEKYCKSGNYLILEPGEFVLACTKEKFNLPSNITAEYKLKSSMGRAGLWHALAGHIDPYFSGQITLEFKNELQCHSIRLEPGMPAGQVTFHRHSPVPYEKGYGARGQYQGDAATMPNKGAR